MRRGEKRFGPASASEIKSGDKQQSLHSPATKENPRDSTSKGSLNEKTLINVNSFGSFDFGRFVLLGSESNQPV
jgi:hypothetical protein